MMKSLGRRPRILAAVCLVLVALAQPTLAQAAEPPDLRPNLRMLRLRDWHLVRSGGDHSTRLLRFTSIIANVGRGPLDIRGQRSCVYLSACPRMTTRQRILRGDGTWRIVPSDALQKYEVGDGHHHWHVIGMERFDLYTLHAPGGGVPIRGQKFGFCFFDERRNSVTPPGTPHGRVYPEYGAQPRNGCGDAISLRTWVGLSVGWADAYPWNFAGQRIDTTGLPDDTYLVCATVDPLDQFLETKESDNQSWTRIRIHGTAVQALDAGRGSCAAQLPDAP